MLQQLAESGLAVVDERGILVVVFVKAQAGEVAEWLKAAVC
jgi:hypothetical protein